MREHPRRGEVWLVDLGDPLGHEAAFRRPGVVISDDPANRHGLAVICPVGSAKRAYPTRVEIEPGRSGLERLSYVQCEQIRAVSTERLIHRLGTIELAAIADVERVLRLVLRL